MGPWLMTIELVAALTLGVVAWERHDETGPDSIWQVMAGCAVLLQIAGLLTAFAVLT